jgi:ribosome-binding protein aMBF1 (putative translation factor)
MSYQDWKPVVLHKTSPKQNKENKENKENDKMIDEIKKIDYFERSFCLKISQLQQQNKMSRKEFAKKLNVSEDIIKNIQNVNNKVKYDGNFVHKCKHLFGNFSW